MDTEESRIIQEIPEQYNFFRPKFINRITESGFFDHIKPTSGTGWQTIGPATFSIKGTDHFIDFSKSYFLIDGKFSGSKPAVKDNAGAETTPERPVTHAELNFGFVNNFADSLISNVEVKLNNTTVTKGDPYYGYISYITKLLSYPKDYADKYLAITGWCKDDANYMSDPLNANNSSLKKRRAFTHNNETLQLKLDLNTPVFMMDNHLLSEVNVDITLYRHANPAFYLMYEEGGNFNFEIQDITLVIHRVKPVPDFAADLQTIMSKSPTIEPCLLSLNHPRMMTLNIPRGNTNFSQGTLFHGILPRRIIICMVSSKSFNGHCQENPYNMQHFNLEEITLYKDGMPYPHPPLRMNFANKKYLQAYHNLISSVEALNSIQIPDIDFNDFGSGYTFISYDMSPDQHGSDDLGALANKSANIRIDMRFATALAEPVTVLVYYEQELKIGIDGKRAVTVAHV